MTRMDKTRLAKLLPKLAPLFRNLRNETFVWQLCQTLLHSRGVFLGENPPKFREFFSALEERPGDLFAVLASWARCLDQI